MTFILCTWNHERGCSVRIWYTVYSVARLWIGQADKSYCHFKKLYFTLVFIHTTSDVHTHSPTPLIPWPSVRGRMKINVTVKFLKWQWALSVWPIHSLATLYTVYKIRTQQSRSWFQEDKVMSSFGGLYIYSLWLNLPLPSKKMFCFNPFSNFTSKLRRFTEHMTISSVLGVPELHSHSILEALQKWKKTEWSTNTGFTGFRGLLLRND